MQFGACINRISTWNLGLTGAEIYVPYYNERLPYSL